MIRTQKEKPYYLYWIHRKTHTNIKNQGYIGVSYDANKRIRQHVNAANRGCNLHICKAIRKYTDIEFAIICVGNFKYICDLETKLRPSENIGWNIRPGGDVKNGFTPSKKTLIKIAKKKVKYSKLDVLNILVDYYEKGLNQSSIGRKYKLDDKSVWRIISGSQIAYKSIEDVRCVLKDDRPFNSSQIGQLPEQLYNEILMCREQGMTWKMLEEKFNIPYMTIRHYCIGDCDYLKKFSCYRVVDNINKPNIYTYKGKTKNLYSWSEICNINYKTLHNRVKNLGWTIEKALETPVIKREK